MPVQWLRMAADSGELGAQANATIVIVILGIALVVAGACCLLAFCRKRTKGGGEPNLAEEHMEGLEMDVDGPVLSGLQGECV